tara:strand:+ start:268 stop:504 length:237 start_codon:yes stop_codon:yes gene_type:complete
MFNLLMISDRFNGPSVRALNMPHKPLITLAATILVAVLINSTLASTTESSSEGKYGASGGIAAGLEKDLPTEEKIPTH